MNKTQYFLKKHSSTILTVVGVTGVVATSVLSVKATPKALTLIEEAKKEKGEDLTPVEVIKVAWKPYIPAAFAGFSTIACILGANVLNVRNQASLMSAYAFLNNSYKEYCEKVNELYGEKADINVRQELVKSKYDNDIELHDDEVLFYDKTSDQFFKSTLKKVCDAERVFLDVLDNKGYACLNEYYDILGIPRVDYGYQLGWFAIENNDPYNCHELEFNYEQVMIDDKVECWIITTSMPPAMDYII